MESKHLMIIGIIGLFFLQNIILLEPQSHTNNNMDKIIFNNVSPSQLYYSYNISIHNSPCGNGYYQQLITLKNYSIYNINSNGSNFYVAYENNTLIYSWIQNINKTVITLWSKILNGTSEIKIDVYNNKTNLFSSNGFLGYNRTYFNAPLVFPYAIDFTNLSGFNGNNAYYTINNGLNLSHYGGITSNLSYGSGYFGYQLKITGNAGGNFEYFAVNNRSSNTNGNESILGASVYNSEYLGYQTRTDSGNKASTANTSYLNNQEVEGYMYIPSLSPSYIVLKVNSKTFNSSTAGDLPVYHQTYLVAQNNNATSWLNMYYWFYSPITVMPTFTQSTNQFYSLNIISKNNGTIINNSYIYNGLFYSNNYINFTVNYSKFSNFYVYALNYSTNFPQYTQFLLTINNYTDNNSGLYYFGTLTILYHTQSIKPLRETTFTQYNMYFLIVIIIFILGLIIYGYKRG